VYKCRIERTDRHGKSHNLLLHLGNVPIRLCFGLDLLGDVTDLVLDGAKFGVVRWPRDDVKTTRTHPRRDRCMDVCGVVGRQIIPDKNMFIISPGDAITSMSLHTYSQKSQKVFADVLMFRTPQFQRRGHSTLPYMLGGRFGSPGSMAKRTVIFWPWP
jgi:hypothetical protein